MLRWTRHIECSIEVDSAQNFLPLVRRRKFWVATPTSESGADIPIIAIEKQLLHGDRPRAFADNRWHERSIVVTCLIAGFTGRSRPPCPFPGARFTDDNLQKRRGHLDLCRTKIDDVQEDDALMNMLPFGRTLAIGAHCDDIEIGCGGTLHRLRRLGCPIYGLIITDTHYSRGELVLRDGETARDETKAAAQHIGYDPIFGAQRNNAIILDEALISFIRGYIEKHSIDTIFTHWDSDAHLDHSKVSQATIMASRDTKNVFMYRSNLYKSTAPFPGNLSIDISETWEVKQQALRCFRSEIERVGNGFLENVEAWNRYDGIAAGTRFAEPFFCLKALL